MFDAIGVSGRTQKPWTVVVSFIGQMGMVGLAILVPLVCTDALPHRFDWITIPEPPRGIHHKAGQPATVKRVSAVPSQITPKGLVLPTRVPDKAVILQDQPEQFQSDNGVGVPGGFGDPNGSGNSVIDSVVRQAPTVVPPPPQVVAREGPKPIRRITVGGNVQKGKLISGPRPIYPPLARQARIAGVVRLQAVISREGAIVDLRAVGGHPLLIPAALAAVSHWVFSPTSLNGDPVEVATEIEVNFTLQ